MRPSRLLAPMGALSLILSAPRSAPAQQPALSACTYDSCALRVEPRFLGLGLLRGAAGVPVARVGLFGPNLERIVQGADSAVRHARRYHGAQNRGGAATLGGVVLGAVALAQCDDTMFISPDCSDSALPLFIGGLALTVYGGVELTRANRALSRTVWWYNRALAR